jgi:tetratricopeptide (TPR) repeat protein
MRRATPAVNWYDRGCALEGCDPGAAVDAYQRALAGQPALADAWNNLGRLLHDQGDLPGAESCYRLAICSAGSVPLYWFNLGVAVEDQGRAAEAIAAYEHAVAVDGAFADAHFNLARLYELRGRAAGGQLAEMQAAVRHLQSYRKIAGIAESRRSRRR